jgi:hypothetical protein
LGGGVGSGGFVSRWGGGGVGGGVSKLGEESFISDARDTSPEAYFKGWPWTP